MRDSLFDFKEGVSYFVDFVQHDVEYWVGSVDFTRFDFLFLFFCVFFWFLFLFLFYFCFYLTLSFMVS